MKGSSYRIDNAKPKSKPRLRRLLFGLILLMVLVIAASLVYQALKPSPSAPTDSQQTNDQTQTEPSNDQAKPNPPVINLQPVLDKWLTSTSAKYSIEVYDVQNQQVIASHEANQAYFTASLYKLFVAYLGYQQLSNGLTQNTANYQGNHSRLECLDLMIKNSDSPCAETMMAELGRDYINSQLASLGSLNTDFGALTTSAHDMNQLIIHILLTTDIKENYKADLLKSMDNQIYRQGLAKGFDKATTVGSKVGFNLDINYHESGLITFSDGRQFIVSILSQGQGSPSPLANLANKFQAALLSQ